MDIFIDDAADAVRASAVSPVKRINQMVQLLRTRVVVTYAGQDITRDIALDLIQFSYS